MNSIYNTFGVEIAKALINNISFVNNQSSSTHWQSA